MEIDPTSELLIRLGIFLGLFAGLGGLEIRFPRRTFTDQRLRRWPTNISIAAINQLLTRLVVPVTAIALATQLGSASWGLLGFINWPTWIELIVAVLLLDLAIYLQHRLYHLVPWLWRLHRMHHADIAFDVSTGIRFHPLSVLISAAIKLGAIVLIGPTAIAVLVFEVLLNATSLFNHSNLALPRSLDAVLRHIVVTPDMHRVHHSANAHETNTNFGFNFPWWDRLFGTYRAQPELGHGQMIIGQAKFRSPQDQRLDRLLLQPFLKNQNT